MSGSKDEYRYFRSVDGQVVQRFGGTGYIGVKRGPQGWVWNTADVARIPAEACKRFCVECRRALASGAIVEVTKADFDALYPEQPDASKVKRRGKAEEG